MRGYQRNRLGALLRDVDNSDANSESDRSRLDVVIVGLEHVYLNMRTYLAWSVAADGCLRKSPRSSYIASIPCHVLSGVSCQAFGDYERPGSSRHHLGLEQTFDLVRGAQDPLDRGVEYQGEWGTKIRNT